MSEENDNKLDVEILTVEELLELEGLSIPEYQRPYKWTEKNVNQLIDDILFHKDKSAYRLGTIVFHKDKDKLNIVDGQQRCITLSLIAYALKQENEKNITLLGEKFSNEISIYNLKNNYDLIKRRLSDFTEEMKLFFFKKCEVVKVVLDDISEAFQFFDSQNSRGKDLDPHDLLKAFHLREMGKVNTEEEITAIVNEWESLNVIEVSSIFGDYLYKIKNLSRGNLAINYSKKDIALFKGISADFKKNYPYYKAYKRLHCLHKSMNENSILSAFNVDISFPFQIDQQIINGRRFFELVIYYIGLLNDLKKKENEVLKLLDNYDGFCRIGDQYVKNIFYCALLYYVDRFGEADLDKVIEKLFIWAYKYRLTHYSVQKIGLCNYALANSGEVSIFKLIRDSIDNRDILNLSFVKLSKGESKANKSEKIKDKFIELGYLEREENEQ